MIGSLYTGVYWSTWGCIGRRQDPCWMLDAEMEDFYCFADRRDGTVQASNYQHKRRRVQPRKESRFYRRRYLSKVNGRSILTS